MFSCSRKYRLMALMVEMAGRIESGVGGIAVTAAGDRRGRVDPSVIGYRQLTHRKSDHSP